MPEVATVTTVKTAAMTAMMAATAILTMTAVTAQTAVMVPEKMIAMMWAVMMSPEGMVRQPSRGLVKTIVAV